MDNVLRTEIGKAIVEGFGEKYGHDESNARDVISDICHYMAWQGLTLEQIKNEMDVAYRNFEFETPISS